VPVTKDGAHVTIAVARRPDAQLEQTVRQALGDVPLTYRVTTDWDIDQVVRHSFRQELLDGATYGLFFRHPEESIQRQPLDAWHRRDRASHVSALSHEHRVDEVIRGQPIFPGQAAREIVPAHAPHTSLRVLPKHVHSNKNALSRCRGNVATLWRAEQI